jgi:hypothetical protein
MSNLLTNWKTTLTGALIIVIGGLHTLLGLNIPGAMDLGPALTMGIGLILASDSKPAA